MFPKGWKYCYLENLCTKITVGLAISVTPFMRQTGVKLIRNQNIKRSGFQSDEIVYLDLEFAKAHSSKEVREGDVIAVRTGSNIGEACVVPKDFDGALTFTTLITRPNRDLIYPEFLSMHINSVMGISEVNRLMAGGGKPNLNAGELRLYRILLPSLPEQIKIAQILSTWDKAITQTQQLIESKRRLKQGLMQQLLQGKMRFKEYIQSSDTKSTRFYSYPSDWMHPKIQEFAKEVSERNVDGNAMTVLSCSKYSGFVNSLEYFGKQVFSDDTSNYKVIQHDQFGFPANHIEEGSIGLLKHVDKGMVSPIYIIFDVDKSKVNPDYLYLILKSETYKHIFRSRTSASVDRRGSLRWDEFSDIRVPLPSLSEQARIINLFESCSQVIAGLEFKKEVLTRQKQGLMQKLLTGHIRVKVEA